MAARVYLVRHADAEPRTTTDEARRLTPAGRARFAAHAGALAELLTLTEIRTSPFARARETAGLLAAATGATVEEDPALAAGAAAGRDVLALARRAPAGTALVGHNPEIAEAVALAAGRGAAVPPGTIAALDVTADGTVTVAWIRAPGS